MHTKMNNVTTMNESGGMGIFPTVPFIALGIVNSFSCVVVLNTYLKKLHPTIKGILTVLCIHNIIGFLIGGTTYVFWQDDMNKITCSVLFVSLKSINVITLENLSLVSFVRYHLSWKTANNENKSLLHIITFSITLYGVEYFENIFFASVGITKFVSKCSGNYTSENGLPSVFVLFKEIVVLGIGIFFDIMLVRFLHKRNKSSNGPGHVKLVPWKSSNEEDFDFVVPVSASIVSLFTAVITSVVSFVTLYVGFEFNQITSLFCIFPSILMPTLLALTLRAAKKTKPPPKIPKKLMFHDDNDSEETNDTNNVNEDFEEGDIAVEDVQENLSGNQNPSYPDIVPIYAANVIFVKPFVKDQLQKMELF